MIIYGEKLDVQAIDAKSQTADVIISMVEIDGREMDSKAMIAMLGPETLQKLRKEVASKKNNHAMSQKMGKSKFGGFGKPRYVTLPLEEVLSGDEKAEIRNIRRRYKKGHFGDMLRYYKTDKLDEALLTVYAQVLKTPRIRTVRGIDAAGCLQLELVVKR